MDDKNIHTFLCTNGDCLCELTMSVSQEDFERRFYFEKTMPCPICAREMYEVQQPTLYTASMVKNRVEHERQRVLDEIQDHNKGRLKGLELLMATPAKERCESAQDVYLKEAYFELILVEHLIESLRVEREDVKK